MATRSVDPIADNHIELQASNHAIPGRTPRSPTMIDERTALCDGAQHLDVSVYTKRDGAD
jgi:hypothetical protein